MLLDVYQKFSAGGVLCRDQYTINLPKETTDKSETWYHHQEEVQYLRFRFIKRTKLPKSIYVFNLTNQKIYRYAYDYMFTNKDYENGGISDYTYCYLRETEYTMVTNTWVEDKWIYGGLDDIYLTTSEVRELLKNYKRTYEFFR